MCVAKGPRGSVKVSKWIGLNPACMIASPVSRAGSQPSAMQRQNGRTSPWTFRRDVVRSAPVESVTLTTRSALAQLDALLYLLVASGVGVLTIAIAVAVVLARPDEPGARYLLVAGASFALSLACGL